MIASKKIAVLGLGKEGVSAANYLGKLNQIEIFDDKPKDEIEKEFLDSLKIKNYTYHWIKEYQASEKFDLIVRSPGIKPTHPLIQKFISQGAKLTSATKIFFEDCPAKIIGVTGTKGKGTTATLIYELLKTRFSSVFLAGNIGIPACDILPKLDSQSLAVLELSSFQLLDLETSPHIAVVLMVTTEHLDWHEDEDSYRRAKHPIVAFQTPQDFAVINQDFPASKEFVHKAKSKIFFFSTEKTASGVYLQDLQIISQIKDREVVASVNDIFLRGRHNLQNVLAAVSVAKILEIENSQIQKVLKEFKGLVHRLQFVEKIKGVSYYNDSFSTIPETTIAAIRSFSEPKILILGGSSKNSDFSNLAEEITAASSVKTLILIGEEAVKIKEALDQNGGFKGRIIEGAKNMAEIVSLAKNAAAPGDVVLLSPACASFDMFKNYEHRGDLYIKEVTKLKNG